MQLGVSIDGLSIAYQSDISYLMMTQAPIKFVSFEPLLREVIPDLTGVDWVIIGAMTGPKAVAPKKEWVQTIIDRTRKEGIPLFLKSNLGWHESSREFPTER